MVVESAIVWAMRFVKGKPCTWTATTETAMRNLVASWTMMKCWNGLEERLEMLWKCKDRE